ncbi:MAG: hypothetical protein AAF502_17540 [Bacteroidota bacterium]
MKNSKNWIVIFLVISLFASCMPIGKPDDFDYGGVSDQVYSNEYFECIMKLPDDWVVSSREQTEEITELGKDLVAGDDKKLEAVVNAAEINTANLLTVFQYEVGSPVEYNPSISLVAENIKMAPGIKDGSDYLFQSRRFLQQSQFQYDYLSKEFELHEINGTDFYKMDAFLTYLGLEIKQTYYATIKKGFSFVVVMSYNNDDQKQILEESLKSLAFKKDS